ncbi:MAG: pyridoxamine 5'-phosphate oxidase family protein [Pseudomonadota bacterium]
MNALAKAGAPNGASPFHQGEQQVQARLGVRDIEDWARKVVRPAMPDQHRAFFNAQPFMILAARDAEGRAWASLLSGPDGFITSPDAQTLDLASALPAGDALAGALRPGADIGFLGIEPATRRRNRVNGRVARSTPKGLSVAVTQSFGNCPQYIRERSWRRVANGTPQPARRSSSLTPSQQDWIAKADTFFLASGYRGQGESEAFGMDASHRGGAAGVLRVLDGGRLQFPDYAGNNHYNTLGNLLLDPRVGLLLVDWSSGSLLQISGRAEIDWDPTGKSDDPAAQRLITITVKAVVEQPAVLDLRWQTDGSGVRSLRITETRKESADVTSFVLEARDGGPLPAFQPGQHLPIEVSLRDGGPPEKRTYSLSGPLDETRYRISVKREPEGTVSRFLHEQSAGALLDARTPAGDFLLPEGGRPLVLIGAGVGVTPLVSMLHAVTADGSDRPLLFLQVGRDGEHLPLAKEIRNLAESRRATRLHVALTRPQPGDRADSQGRLDTALLGELLPNPGEADYLLCGPLAFMAETTGLLETLGVPAERIHGETFGPQASRVVA